MSEPTDPASSGPAPKGSTPPPEANGEARGETRSEDVSSTTPTTSFPAAGPNRAEGTSGGVATAYSGGAAGQAAPHLPGPDDDGREGLMAGVVDEIGSMMVEAKRTIAAAASPRPNA